MTAALDGELSPRRQRVLDRHLGRCAACRQEMAVSTRLARALAGLPLEAEVPDAVEQATLRRIRTMVAEAEARRDARAPWLRVLLPALVTAGVVVLALVSVLRVPGGRREVLRTTGQVATTARRSEKSVRVAKADETGAPPATRHVPPPAGPPPALAAAPELFVDLPLLHNMEKLEHFEAIRTTTLDEDVGTPGEPPPSNG